MLRTGYYETNAPDIRVQADGSNTVDITVINLGSKCDLCQTFERSFHSKKKRIQDAVQCCKNDRQNLRTLGGLKGYSGGKWMSSLKMPP